jgi:hypothetical protein
MITSIFSFILRYLVIWITILVASVVGAMVLGLNGEGAGSDGPFTGGPAFLIVNGLHSLVLTTLAVRSSLRGRKLAVLIWVIFFFVQCFLLLMEAAYFIDSLDLTFGFLIKTASQAFFVAICTGIAAGLLWRKSVEMNHEPVATKLPWRIGSITILYIFLYFLAGFFIAWSDPSVQEYYSFGENIALVPLFLFQILRGTLWAFLALYMVRSLRGPMMARAVVIGFAFSVLATAQLLYPNDFMPWSVRLPHMVEVTISNFVFGVLAGLILQIKSFRPKEFRRSDG